MAFHAIKQYNKGDKEAAIGIWEQVPRSRQRGEIAIMRKYDFAKEAAEFLATL